MKFIEGLLAMAAADAAVFAQARTPAAPAEVTAIIANAQDRQPNGVERLEQVRIGATERWVTIRGADRTQEPCTDRAARGREGVGSARQRIVGGSPAD